MSYRGVGEKHYRNGLPVEETNWEKWAGEPRPGDAAGAYSYEQLLRMDGNFTALERAFAAGLESPLSARRIYVAKGWPTSDPGRPPGVSAAATPFSSFSTCLASSASIASQSALRNRSIATQSATWCSLVA